MRNVSRSSDNLPAIVAAPGAAALAVGLFAEAISPAFRLAALTHSHPHYPDLHHRHSHGRLAGGAE